jgi:hypothetical protein
MFSLKDWLDPCAWVWLILFALSVRFCLRKRRRLGLSLAALALVLSISETGRQIEEVGWWYYRLRGWA